jgi:hypothetical protein
MCVCVCIHTHTHTHTHTKHTYIGDKPTYIAKAQVLRSNLTKNSELRRRVISDELLPTALVEMNADQLADSSKKVRAYVGFVSL